MARAAPIYRAPMRARDRDLAAGLGAEFGLEAGVVGIGDVLSFPPASLDDAIDAAAREHGEKAGRMLERFAGLPIGALVWTRATDGLFHLGEITGDWRYDSGVPADAVGLPHLRPTRWLDRPFGEGDVPPGVEATFARGGRNLQRINDEDAERRTAELWREFGAEGAPAG